MRTIKLLTYALALSFIMVTGCQEDKRITPLDAQPKSTSSDRTAAELKAQFARLGPRLQPNDSFLGKTHTEYQVLMEQALDITPTVCDGNTPHRQWLTSQRADWSEELRSYIDATQMYILPSNYTYLFENSSANQVFGSNGEYTQQLTKTFKDLKRFWNIQSDDLIMVAAKGSMLADQDKLINTYKAAYGFDDEKAAQFADFVLYLLETYPQLSNGNHPYFSYNAFVDSSKIVMGDGYMQGFSAVGYGDVAPQVMLAHEFGHVVQFQLGLIGTIETPEESRRIEMMADAYSAYYLSHSRGAAMQWKRMQQFLKVFFTIGDCQFTNPAHHGTPAERMATAEWAYKLANDAQKQGHILTAQEFVTLFEAQLPQLVAR